MDHGTEDLELLAELTGSVLVALHDDAGASLVAGATTSPLGRLFGVGDWRAFLTDADLDELRHALTDTATDELHRRVRLRDDRWIELHGRSRAGRWTVAAVDVTDQVRSELALAEARHILEATSDLVVVSDLETGEVLWSNDTATVILGLAPGIPRGLHDILPDGALDDILDDVRVSGSWSGVIDLQPAPHYVVPCKIDVLRGVRPTDRRETVSLLARDISDLRAVEGRLRWAAEHDTLTGLANRGALEAHLDQLLRTSRVDAPPSSLLYLDLDGFKPINDQHGHAAGDEVLRTVGERLLGSIRADDLACRVGGDEFVVVARRAGGPTAAALADRITESVRRPVDVGGAQVSVGVSVGVVELTGDLPDAATAIRRADEAMYAVKRRRRSSRPAGGEERPGGVEVLGVGDADPPLG